MPPDRFVRYQQKRARYWPQIIEFLGRLPVPLFEQARLVQHNLGTALSDTGQFCDILKREHDHPLLYLPFWLLDAGPAPAHTVRHGLERHLPPALVYALTVVYIQQAMREAGSTIDHSFSYLAHRLSQQADWHLSCLFPATDPFWTHHRRFWNEYSAAALADTADPVRLLAPAKIAVTAAALLCRQADELPRLWQLTDRLNFVHQILYDFASLRQNLFDGRPSYPITKIRQTLGLPADAPLSPERALGALVLTGAAQMIQQECDAAVQSGQNLAATLELPLFQAHFSALADWLPRVFTLFEVQKQKTSPGRRPSPRANFFRPAVDPIPAAITMAERFLLADPELRESWEVQRRGAFGVAEMTARAFPSGLIVEILCRHGHELPARVENIFAELQATGGRYFDFEEMPPDSDDLGLLLRLHRYAARPDAPRALLQKGLSRLARAVETTGQIPVWLPEPDTAVDSLALWGKQCVAVEANVLLGLLDFAPAAYEAIIVQAVESLTQRWPARGWGALGHYTPTYWLWIGFELVHRLRQAPFEARLAPARVNLQTSLGEYFRRAHQPARLSPQTAALLSLAARTPGNPQKELFDPRWLTLLIKSQRYDGSWAGEPLYSTPTRGEQAAWYSSRSVTTAICYHALKSCQS